MLLFFPEGIKCDGHDALVPELLVTIDTAHASRRLLSRTFKLDAFMDKVLSAYVLGKRTIVEIIENSIPISDMFGDAVRSLAPEEAIDGQFQNLGMAKHRFSSLAKRLGRLVGKVIGVFETANNVRIQRAGTQVAKDASAFLDSIDPEEYIQLGMMADAADEAYVFTTDCDSEDADISLQADEVAMFVENCDFLFIQNSAVDIPGYTQFAVNILRKARVLNVSKDGY